ncbi:DUF2141 domain-containing protein [uncultured Abyssibacter sp.]|uniref:DUF2141 domain-containing protein n=1 Tax=uncultured Abyssibacter sp. TaxID=2320202 RepID=UPI0032B1DB24
MKTLTGTLLISALFALPLAGQAADLTVRIDKIREASGHLFLKVCADATCWDGDGEAVSKALIPADTDGVQHVVADLEPGRYAVIVMHDENDNGEFDMNFMGIPKEGYGYSNNPRVMRKATFDEAAVDVPEGGLTTDLLLR